MEMKMDGKITSGVRGEEIFYHYVVTSDHLEVQDPSTLGVSNAGLEAIASHYRKA